MPRKTYIRHIHFNGCLVETEPFLECRLDSQAHTVGLDDPQAHTVGLDQRALSPVCLSFPTHKLGLAQLCELS